MITMIDDIPGLDELNVELYCADVDAVTPSVESTILDIISADERRRHDRFRHEPSRRCYLLGRWMTRRILADIGDRDAQAWRFDTEEHGRPFLVNPTSRLEGVDFNIAHSNQRVAMAVTRQGRVGVDLEPVGRRVDHAMVAERHFHPDECAAIEELDEPERRRRFLQLWVLKEAWMKADGRGIGAGLSRVVFEFGSTGQARLVDLPPGHQLSRWTIVLEQIDDHLLAIAHRC